MLIDFLLLAVGAAFTNAAFLSSPRAMLTRPSSTWIRSTNQISSSAVFLTASDLTAPASINFLSSPDVYIENKNEFTHVDYNLVYESAQHSLLQAVAFLPQIQNIFIAAMIVALLQAGVAMYSYASNPVGTLVIPPGLTVGVERPSKSASGSTKPKSSTRANVEEKSHDANTGKMSSDNVEILSNEDGHSSRATSPSVKTSLKTAATEMQSGYARLISRANRLLPIFLPLLARNVGLLLFQNAHLLHIGFISALIKIFDFPTRFWPQRNKIDIDFSAFETNSSTPVTTVDELSRVCVIGDSLAVGMGTVDSFDVKGPVPYYRIEHLVGRNHTSAPSNQTNENQTTSTNGDNLLYEPSPEFPRAFARALAARRGAPVSWRSAGVDGGTVRHIDEFCKGVVEEEVAQNRPPDVVVIICGANDLKYFISHPFSPQSSARHFRRNLVQLIADIKKVSPSCKVVLPDLPSQVFHKNSPLNVFPLGIFIDAIAGFWNSQKKQVADLFPFKDVVYVSVTADDVRKWYERDNILISADGVHPNKQCYASWAETVVNKLCDAVRAQTQRQQKHQIKERQKAMVSV